MADENGARGKRCDMGPRPKDEPWARRTNMPRSELKCESHFESWRQNGPLFAFALVRPHIGEAGRCMGRNEMPWTLCGESTGAKPKLR
jgi:hypothetical protein